MWWSRVGDAGAGDLAGTYLVEVVEQETADGVRHPFGEKVAGMLLYGADGSMAAVVGAADRPSLDMDLLAATAGASDREMAEAFRSSYGFAGSYEIVDGAVHHHIAVSTVPNWVGTDQIRPFSLAGDQLILRPPGWRVVARRAPVPARGRP